jgi:predicted  nucleic acid-binding Zn-ribbon protein
MKWGSMEDSQALLIAEQLNRLKDNIDARLKRIEATIDHFQTLESEKLLAVKAELKSMKDDISDHETRIRTVDDAVISLKTISTIAQAGQAALTLIAASLAAWLGGQR